MVSRSTAVPGPQRSRAFPRESNASMGAATYPLPRGLLPTFSGIVNRHPADVSANLVEEDRVLKDEMMA